MYTGTRLTTAIHRRLLSRFFLREGGRLHTGYAPRFLEFLDLWLISLGQGAMPLQLTRTGKRI